MVSERRACKTLGQPRSSQRLKVSERGKEKILLVAIEGLVRDNPRFGSRKITDCLRLAGWNVNYKRIHRLWKREGYRVPKTKKKKRVVGMASNACDKRRAECMNDVWTWDFIFDRLEDGRQLKVLTVTDEYTRESLAVEVGRSFSSDQVLDVLQKITRERGVPCHIRSDNGSEFISRRIKDWLASTGAEGLYIDGGAPWQNGYAESFNSRFRDECLNMNLFYTVKEAREITKLWQKKYNEKRPHSSLGGMTPKMFAARCQSEDGTPLRSAPPSDWQNQQLLQGRKETI
jgi:transposase InsO family protein